MQTVLNIIGFQVTWFACVLGAANGHDMLGLLVALATFGLHVALAPTGAADARLAPLVALAGFLADSALAAGGVLDFGPHVLRPWPCPPWMFGLWLSFATLLRTSLPWLARRPSLAAVLGLLAGPATYYAAARLGALALPSALPVTVMAVGVEWAVAMPTMLWLSRTLPTTRAAAAHTPEVE